MSGISPPVGSPAIGTTEGKRSGRTARHAPECLPTPTASRSPSDGHLRSRSALPSTSRRPVCVSAPTPPAQRHIRREAPLVPSGPRPELFGQGSRLRRVALHARGSDRSAQRDDPDRLLDVHPGDGPSNDEPLDLAGALEDGVDLRDHCILPVQGVSRTRNSATRTTNGTLGPRTTRFPVPIRPALAAPTTFDSRQREPPPGAD